MKKIFTILWAFCAFNLLISQEIVVRGINVNIIDGATGSTLNNGTNFGKQQSSSGTIVQRFTIENIGNSNLTIGTFTISGSNSSDFTVTTSPSSPVSPGGSTFFEVTFNPSATGSRTANVSFVTNDADENPFNFDVAGTGISNRTVRWVNNQGASRPSSVTLQGLTYNTAATTYTSINSAIVAAGTDDIVYITDGTYANPRRFTSTNCSLFGMAQDTSLYLNVNKSNIIITSETGDYNTSSAYLVGYGFNLISEFSTDITIQGLIMDSVRTNAFWNSNTVWGPSSNVKILNNLVMNTYGHGVKTDGALQVPFSTFNRGLWKINGNQFENIGFNKYSACSYQAVSAIWLSIGGPTVEIKDNTIINTKWAGVLTVGYGSNSPSISNGGITISNNVIEKTVDAGIQIGFPTDAFFYPSNALIQGNYIKEANTSSKVGIGAITMLYSDLAATRILNNHITQSFNGLAIEIAGWRAKSDTTIVRYNNFCQLSGGFAVTHIAGISPNCVGGGCTTGDDLAKYKFDNNYWGDPSGPKYAATNPSGLGQRLRKDTITLGAGTYSLNDYNYLTPFSTSPNANALAGSCLCPPEINVKGNNVSIVDGDITPSISDSTNMDTVFVNTTRSFKIENTGGSALLISSITLSGTNAASYTITGAPTSVPKDSVRKFYVTFTGTTVGAYTATININNSDCNEGVYNFDIKTYKKAIPCDFSNPPATSIATHTASISAVNGAGWTCYCNSANEFLLGIKIGSTGAVIPTSGVQLKINSQSAVYYPFPTGFVGNPTGWIGLARTWNVTPSTQPSTSIPVRLMFTQKDIDSINVKLTQNSLTNISAPTDMSFYKVINGSKPAHAAISTLAQSDVNVYMNDVAPSLTKWKDSSLGGSKYLATLLVSSFSGGGGGAGPGGLTPLPVNFMKFEGKTINNQINLLKWSASVESMNSSFEITRSTDGKTFETIGNIDAQMNMNEYQFIDKNINKGVQYFYQLKLKDENLMAKFSNVISLKTNETNSQVELVNLFPNPASQILNINPLTEDYNVTITIFNYDGKEILSKQISEMNQTIDIKDLSNGIYTVIIKSETNIQSTKLVINK